MKFEKVSEKYINDAVDLALVEYKNECERCGQLIKDNYKNKLYELITNLFKSKYGVVALEENKLIGYLSFWGPWDGFFGNDKGAFSPLAGSAFSGSNRNKLTSLLVEKVSQNLVDDGITSIAICRYAHDEESERSLVFNGFGIRCSDAIRDLSNSFNEKKFSSKISFCEINKDDYRLIRHLKKQLVEHLCKAPIFFPTNLNEIEAWFNDNRKRIFIAKNESKIIGYIQVGYTGENFITENKSMRNICGTYLEAEYRGMGVSEGLLDYICEKLKSEGVTYLGVDCETLNPNALRFWGKHFENYTYSFHRRVDERIVGYKKYLEDIK